MYPCLAITFRNGACVLVPVPEEDRNRLLNFMMEMSEKSGFFELATIFDQPVWLNMARVSQIHFLLEHTNLLSIEMDGIAPSKLTLDESKNVDLDEVELLAHIWTGAEREPIEVCGISGNDWMEATTSFHCGEQFFVVNDEDCEPLAVAMSDMNMLIGTETTRYSDALLDTVRREIFGTSDVPPA